MLLESLSEELPEVGVALTIFLLALPLEAWFGTGQRASTEERLGNLGALLVHFSLGGACMYLLLQQPFAETLTSFPAEPRLEALQHPLLWTATMLLVMDGLYYVYHRLQHAVPLLWRIHKLHHTDPVMNITTSKRTHFLEQPLQFLLVVAPALWIVGLNVDGLASMAIAGPFFLYFAHLNVRWSLGILTPVIVGPHFHRVHHSREVGNNHSNFAQAFPLFDLLGGTYRRPLKDEFPKTGVEGCQTTLERWRPILW